MLKSETYTSISDDELRFLLGGTSDGLEDPEDPEPTGNTSTGPSTACGGG